MQVLHRLKYVFESSHKRAERNALAKLALIKPKLEELRSSIETISKSDDHLANLVLFFETMSWWHDRGGVKDVISAFEVANKKNGRYRNTIFALKVLESHIKNAGRNESGWNRTKIGETVTEDNVFLGAIYGLFTKPVSFWRRMKEGATGGLPGESADKMNAFNVVSDQAVRFLRTHTVPLRGDVVDRLLDS